ncbi:MAG: Zeta toxin family protein, partial [Rhodanobacteraceae bacterium]
IKAGRLMLREMAEHVARGGSFAFETTLAGTHYARGVPRWQQLSYRVTLIFLALPSADVAVARVAQRVRQGGHDVDIDVIRRRFVAGRRNFERLYRGLVDDWVEYDNFGTQPRPVDWKCKA